MVGEEKHNDGQSITHHWKYCQRSADAAAISWSLTEVNKDDRLLTALYLMLVLVIQDTISSVFITHSPVRCVSTIMPVCKPISLMRQ